MNDIPEVRGGDRYVLGLARLRVFARQGGDASDRKWLMLCAGEKGSQHGHAVLCRVYL